MKKLIVTAAVCALLSGAAFAQEGPWLVRARAVGLDMANKDATGLGLTVNNKTIPEVDATYFFNKNVAAELVLTVPQKQTVSSNGVSIGTFKHLPPTLTVQWHFDGNADVKPYVGAGINYTHLSKVDLSAANASLDSHSWGTALQAGVDFPIDKNLSFNIDVKKVYLQTNVYVGGVDQGVLKLNPTLIGAGLGYRF
jgi:outer membrane protein